MSACPQINIGLVAYGVTSDLVLVRVPNERGRWVMTDRCVVEVGCTVCGSVAGEPCANRRSTRVYYWAGTHCARRHDWQHKRRKEGGGNCPVPKLRVRPSDIADARTEPPAS